MKKTVLKYSLCLITVSASAAITPYNCDKYLRQCNSLTAQTIASPTYSKCELNNAEKSCNCSQIDITQGSVQLPAQIGRSALGDGSKLGRPLCPNQLTQYAVETFIGAIGFITIPGTTDLWTTTYITRKNYSTNKGIIIDNIPNSYKKDKQYIPHIEKFDNTTSLSDLINLIYDSTLAATITNPLQKTIECLDNKRCTINNAAISLNRPYAFPKDSYFKNKYLIETINCGEKGSLNISSHKISGRDPITLQFNAVIQKGVALECTATVCLATIADGSSCKTK